LIIDKGKKIVEGTADELLDPAKTIVDIDTTDNQSAINKIAETDWNKYRLSNKGKLQFQFNRDQIPSLVSDLVTMNINVLSVQPRHSLENYFLSLTTLPHVEAAAV
jgi:ABC-type multidrug transport system ATPase subunit